MLIVAPSGGEDFNSTIVEHPDGHLTFREPILGQDLDGITPPDILRTWPVLSTGYDFWEEAGDNTDFSLLLSRHNTRRDLERSGIDLRAEAIRIQAARGLLLLEGVHDAGDAGAITRGYNDVSQGERPDRLLDMLSFGPDDFMMGVLEAIHNTKVRVEFPDMRYQDPATMDLLGPIHHVLRGWLRAANAADQQPPSLQSIRDAHALHTGFQIFREHVLVGYSGAMMSRLRTYTSGRYVGGLIMGRVHRGVAAKVDALTGNTTRIIGSDEGFDEINKIGRQNILDASVSQADIERVHQISLGPRVAREADGLPAAASTSTTTASGASA